jgi:hypothetical protein
VEKEHVSVCLKIQIGDGTSGTRKGFLLLDPGYNISRVITVMEDKIYPHTGIPMIWVKVKTFFFFILF